jgi:glycosyltransferase involved in cell wall biosynthesis
VSTAAAWPSPARVSVLMPTFDQAAFLPRAVVSLLAQSYVDWDLIVLDDGSPSPKATWGALSPLMERRIRFERRDVNVGLGAAMNAALDLASGELIAYLPSDDVWLPEHLESLVACLDGHPEAVLAYSGVRSELRVPLRGVIEQRTSDGAIHGLALRPVQVLHRRGEERWVERTELVTDDLDVLYWSGLRARGTFVGTGRCTCEWVDHPQQWHKVIREPLGGINPYRSRYRVTHPLRFASTVGNPIDEVETYRRFRERPDTPMAPDGLTVLLAGELAFNPERVLAIEERGHRLFGLWTESPIYFSAVGPQPFGHITDLPRDGWIEAARDLQPDVVYALLNWEAVPFAHQVLEAVEAPVVWHFKESPFECIANGTWPQLFDLVTKSAAQVYSSAEMRDWFHAVDPRIVREGVPMVLDGDLPKADWFANERSTLLSDADGEIHTVVPGGPIGITPALVAALASASVHLHFYGDFHRAQWSGWVEACSAVAPRTLHLHPQVGHAAWVTELSQYDAGWLHQVHSINGGDMRRARWEDMNVAARFATYAVSGLPMILPDNDGHRMATQSLVRELGVGVLWREPDDLIAQLSQREAMSDRRSRMWDSRESFTFDDHVDELIELFRRVGAEG